MTEKTNGQHQYKMTLDVSMTKPENERTKHQLTIHIDYHPDGKLEVIYSYPFSKPHEIKEHVVTKAGEELTRGLKEDLGLIVNALRSRIYSKPIRLPHAEVVPHIDPTIATIVIQDQRRGHEIPCARLYYLESIEQISSRCERELHMKREDFTQVEREAFDRIRAATKGIAWKDYEMRMGDSLRKSSTS